MSNLADYQGRIQDYGNTTARRFRTSLFGDNSGYMRGLIGL